MLKVLILVCAASVSPADCTPDNALTAAPGPEVSMPWMCGLYGQSQLAQSAIPPDSDSYEKVVCEAKR